MKRMSGVLVLVVFVLAGVTTWSFADDYPMGRCGKRCMSEMMESKMDLDDMFSHKVHFIMANAEAIGLSDEQAEKVMMMKYAVKRNLIKDDADIESLALDIKEALGKEEVDINAVNMLIDKKYSAKAKKTKEIIGACMEIKKMLTKEQYKKLKDMWMGRMMCKATYGKMMEDRGEKPMMRMQKEAE